MTQKFKHLFLTLMFCMTGIIGCCQQQPYHAETSDNKTFSHERSRDKIVQISTLQALINGRYDQVATYGELAPYGDFGIGTFNALDGEMILVDNALYRVADDGVARLVSREEGTPFAMLTHFDVDQTIQLMAPVDSEALYKKIDAQLPSENIFYAIKIKGEFKKIKVRSVPKQKKPYPDLTQIVKTQPVFELENVRGELVGFRMPEFMAKSNMPGYHLHFLTENRKAGGHLLSCEMSSGTVYIDSCSDIQITLPKNKDYLKKHAREVTDQDVQNVESLHD